MTLYYGIFNSRELNSEQMSANCFTWKTYRKLNKTEKQQSELRGGSNVHCGGGGGR